MRPQNAELQVLTKREELLLFSARCLSSFGVLAPLHEEFPIGLQITWDSAVLLGTGLKVVVLMLSSAIEGRQHGRVV